MKRLGVFCLGVLVSVLTFSAVADASEASTVSEKIWTVELNLPALVDSINLDKIKVLNEEGDEVPITVEVDKYNEKFLEVFSPDGFKEGEYDFIIPAGFESKTGEVTQSEYVKSFTVSGSMTHENLSAQWETSYHYLGILYDIKTTFNNGHATLKITDTAAGIEYRGTETYELKTGNMVMYVDDLRLNLDGNIRYYNEGLFKIVTASGKYTYFKKLK